jgi:uncharacterized protein (DUF488 family)
MFYRRKLILKLLEAINRPLSNVEMQKLTLFLSKAQEQPAYEFIPHRFGCFSYQLEADKSALTKYQHLRKTDDWVLDGRRKNRWVLKESDLKAIFHVVENYAQLKGRDLIRASYQTFPFYALNSEIAEELLEEGELKAVQNALPTVPSARLFTIGYEGRSFENYLTTLMVNGVKLLCDVRRNPMSMKFGFNKRQMERGLGSIGIKYLHIPELGVDRNLRQALESQADYDTLFDEYRSTVLIDHAESVSQLVGYIDEYERIALTCFERSPGQCHRGCITDAIAAGDDFRHKIEHI